MTQSDNKILSSILAQTEDGHYLIDAYQGLANAAPAGWQIHTTSGPPTEPYDGFPKSTSSRSKKRKKELSTNEQLNQAHHDDLASWLQDAIDRVRDAWLSNSPSTWSPAYPGYGDSDGTAQEELDLAALEESMRDLQTLAPKVMTEGTSLTLQVPRTDLSLAGLCNHPILNASHLTSIIVTPSASFAIPLRSGFLLGDFACWNRQLSALSLSYDLVLLDPPWRSKSVRRSTSYEEMDMYDLFKIDLPSLLLKQAANKPVLVGVWVTNHPKHRKFVKEKLLPDWDVSGIVDWYWVKVTENASGAEASQGGLPVWSLDGPSPRRCYEGLILGYHNPFHLPVPSPLPDKKAFLSVPLAHSRKPLLLDLLRSYLSTKYPYVLELFARFTPSGCPKQTKKGFWMSVGNEAIKFNQTGVHLRQSSFEDRQSS